jgi:hypothetical protein
MAGTLPSPTRLTERDGFSMPVGHVPEVPSLYVVQPNITEVGQKVCQKMPRS